MGTPDFAATSLARLIETGSSPVGVVTRPDRARGRGKKVVPCAVAALAEEHSLPLLQPESARTAEFADALAELQPDLVIVVAYGRILPTEILNLPPLGCINAHASLLPALRGAAPIERAILGGLTETGITIMQINEEMDAGDMLSKSATPIGESETAGALRERLAILAADALVDAVAMIRDGKAVPTPQDPSAVTFAPPLRREETRLDFTASAVQIDRTVRGFAPKPGAWTMDAGKRLKILEGQPLADATHDKKPGQLVAPEQLGPDQTKVNRRGINIACGQGLFLATKVQAEGRSAVTADEYVRGRHDLSPDRCLGA